MNIGRTYNDSYWQYSNVKHVQKRHCMSRRGRAIRSTVVQHNDYYLFL